MNADTLSEFNLQSLVESAVEKQQLGQLKEAESIYKLIVEILPDIETETEQDSLENQDNKIAIIVNLGTVLRQQGKLEEAAQTYRQAIALDPNCAEAYNNLGSTLDSQGKFKEAIAAYENAISIKPDSAGVYNNLGNALQEQNDLENAIAAYENAIAINPDLAEAHYNLGNIFHSQGKLEAAIESYQQTLRCNPDFEQAKFGICIAQLPVIYATSDEIHLRRNNYQHHLQNLAHHYQEAGREKQAKAADAVGSLQPFFLAYQGLCDRDLQQIYGETICQLMATRYPQWSKPIALSPLEPNEKIRVGVFSGYFHNHSVWKIPVKGWVQNLDRSKFELFGYYTDTKRDRETVIAQRAFDKFTQASLPVENWCETIAKDKLHVLIFPEFGMNPISVQLGCLRLAPIQITSWGHPDTSGMPTIDYYLSSDLMEPDNAIEHYTEKLVRLPNLSIHYTPLPVATQRQTKQDIGIENDEVMFWCCQSLYKYLPQHDDIFPRIAKAVGQCKFVFIEYIQGNHVTERFKERLSNAFGSFRLDYRDYCLFLPRLEAGTFAGVAAIADILLDSIGWSGCNSTLESIAHDIPVVTLSGDLMRGRHTTAILKMMDIQETSASNKEDYINIAARLGRDPQYRQEMARQIADNKYKLYGDLQPIIALENFLLTAVHKKVLQLAVQYHRSDRLTEAQQTYHKILQRQPDEPEALYGLGVLSNQIGDRDKAEQIFTDILKIQPKSVKTLVSMGNLQQAFGKLTESVEFYQKALSVQPNAVLIYNNLGYVLQQQGKLDNAIACYQKALQLQPNLVEAEVNLANALFIKGELPFERQTHYAALNAKLGFTQHQQGNVATALECYRQALAMQPDLGEVYYHSGIALEQQNQLEDAIACYKKAIELNCNCGEAYYRIGTIYQEQNRLLEAISSYKKGLTLINPHYARAIESGTTQKARVTPQFPHRDFRPPSPPNLGGKSQNPPSLGDLGGCHAIYSTENCDRAEVVIGEYQFPAIPSVSNSNEKRPFWSVVIPVHNRTQYILECLASVLAQWTGEEDMEIIVIDDASTSPIFELVKAIGAGIVRYYRNPQNLKQAGTWNAGISLSRGQWIHLLHDDDYVLPGFYSQLKQSLEGCTESIGAACTGYENINERGVATLSKQLYGTYKGIAENFLELVGITNPLNPPAVVIRRTTYERLGGYHPDFTFLPDWEMYKRIAAYYDWWNEPDILVRYRQHSQSMTAKRLSNDSPMDSIRRAIAISESYLPANSCAQITARSRNYYFQWCLERAEILLEAGNLSEAFRVIQDALKCDRSSEAVRELLVWLTQDNITPIQDEIVLKLLS
ncbi:MAG: tetratricopeptide repeat protein [Hydrococcus sp. Prado102]|jgi:predicted O-linked N-acetylglucosamine transferase (SPINDLY family)/glycosyltransferase involved in cell wall biosynthesis|nr:tetratricopeptide repeat protein [Hydrococcus sp. Prado102]